MTTKNGTISLAFIWGLLLKLRAEGSKLWADAILEVHGNITLEWLHREKQDDYACKLETGEVFEPEKKE